MLGRIFHPQSLGMSWNSNHQQSYDGQMDVTPLSGTVLNLGVLCHIDSSDILNTSHSVFISSKFSNLGALASVKFQYISTTMQKSFPTSTLRLTVGIIIWEGVVFGFWAFRTGIAAVLTVWIWVWSALCSLELMCDKCVKNTFYSNTHKIQYWQKTRF